ncbi:hypothetical protein [Sodalis sp. RH22]|uniref:hypothetical protein n=1 Tax=unclassified Sodalis (in: enterobacteria) TaxID=2636512 RepID=UPI0039B4D8F5
MQDTERTINKERPILFNTEMVRAILDGRKTQTRRAVRFPFRDKYWGCELAGNELAGELKAGRFRNSPLGQLGDRLWVRETWGVVSHAFNDDGFRIPWTPHRPATPVHEMPFGNGYYSGHVIYRADGGFIWSGDDDGDGERTAWHPSIHMPRKASRIDLMITGVRVERLQDVTDEDARSEGCPTALPKNLDDYRQARTWFRGLWSEIYGEESWAVNPWLWVISFELLAKDGEQ